MNTAEASAHLERDRRISDQLVRLIQIVFALVVAQSLFLYREVIVHPFARSHRVALIALLAVFVTTVLSWIDWHITMELHPYDRQRRIEWVRLAADLLIVVLYAYLLFTVESFVDSPGASVQSYLLGFPLVFSLYLLSGIARRAAYGVAASRLVPILVFLCFFAALWVMYTVGLSDPASSVRNSVFLGLVLSGMIGYRAFRAWYRKRSKMRKERGKRIGIDIDGVVADQVGSVLPRIQEDLGVSLTKNDVTDWRLPLANSDIAAEINKALLDPAYVLNMPTLPGAARLLNALFPHHEIVMVTARPDAAIPFTRVWLERKGLAFDRIVSSGEMQKSLHGCDVLVDDYLGNVLEFLSNSEGVAVLVDQPWNRDRKELEPLISSGRAFVAASLDYVPALIRETLGE